ncbi:unnamed protein product [Rotaria socialis]|uniref:Uncharacterized protein n=1 Tax=Rotaria socialis TaxID=392032 RepID=A0A821GUN6_9BILA|nr:unnamed protein product [Rotaria socialis]CAF4673076.1 unnamed protein product [Rotaria socialis]
MPITDMKCKVTIEIILGNYLLYDGGQCASCKQPIGTHRSQNEVVKEINKSNKSHEDVNIEARDNVNYKYDESGLEKKSTSISSYEIVDEQNDDPPSLLSDSNDSESMKSYDSNDSESMNSSASSEAHFHLHSSTTRSDSQQTANNNKVIQTKLEDQATRTVSERRSFLCKEFLRKHYCSHMGSGNFEELYVRIFSMINQDTNRVHHLMKHARHSCLGLVQITMNDDQLMDLFKFLNSYLPPIFKENI